MADSVWAMAPARAVTEPLQKERSSPDGEHDFTPKLMSNPDMREKVQSTGYGIAVVSPTKANPKELPTREEAELEGATFKPNLKQFGSRVSQQRKNATSAGYGTAEVGSKKIPKAEKYSFTPKTTLSSYQKQIKKQATSSGYGTAAAASPKRAAQEKLSFKPNLNVSPMSAKLRKQAPSKSYLQERAPRPNSSRGTKKRAEPLRHSLAADRGQEEVEEDKDVGPGFDFSAREDNLAGTCQGGVFPAPEPAPLTAMAKKIYESATSAGYASRDYEPPVAERVEREEPKLMRTGTANSTYLDTTADIGKFERPATAAAILEKVTSSGYASTDYEPKVGEIFTKEPEPKFNTAYRATTPGLEELERPTTSTKRNVESTGYGQKWLPPVGEKFQREYYDAQGDAHYEEGTSGGGDGGDDDQVTSMPLVDNDDIVDEY